MNDERVPVIISWVDTFASASWDEAEEVNIMPVLQIGWLIYQDEQQVKLADTMTVEDGKNAFYGITAIPASSVKKIRHLNREMEFAQGSPLEEVF